MKLQHIQEMLELVTQNDAVLKAGIRYYELRSHKTKPLGTIDKNKHFHPNDKERCSCCSAIEPPSHERPYSYIIHCRTPEHVANNFDVSDQVNMLKRIATFIENENSGSVKKLPKAMKDKIKYALRPHRTHVTH